MEKDERGLLFVNEQTCVRDRRMIVNLFKPSPKRLIPIFWRLLQTIQRLVETTNCSRVSRVNKTCRLGAVDSLAEGSMQESILDVELMDRPMLGESDGQNCTDSSRFERILRCLEGG